MAIVYSYIFSKSILITPLAICNGLAVRARRDGIVAIQACKTAFKSVCANERQTVLTKRRMTRHSLIQQTGLRSSKCFLRFINAGGVKHCMASDPASCNTSHRSCPFIQADSVANSLPRTTPATSSFLPKRIIKLKQTIQPPHPMILPSFPAPDSPAAHNTRHTTRPIPTP